MIPSTENNVGLDGYQLPLPMMSIVKTADVTVDVMAGQTITYTYEVNNTGNTLINNITIVDVHSGLGLHLSQEMKSLQILLETQVMLHKMEA